MRNRPIGAVIYGVDLGKNRFDVVACDAMGKPMQRLKLTRHTLLPFFGQVGPDRHGGMSRGAMAR